MPIVPPAMVAAMQGHWAGIGWIGVNMAVMATAIGTGAGVGMVGATFETADAGTGIAPGAGIGTGITIIEAALSGAMFSAMLLKFPPGGADLADFCDGIAKGIKAGLDTASLVSVHEECYLGVGIVTGGVVFAGSGISSGIKDAAPTFTGDNWADVCEVIGTEIQNIGLTAIGQVVITGTPPGAPVTAPPTASGTGVIA